MAQVVIIGGNAAGLAAATRAKRTDPRLDITVVEKLPHIAYSTCGAPYFLERRVKAEDLIAYTPESFEKERGVKVRNNVRVTSIVPGTRRVEGVRADTNEKVSFSFDRLLIATGVKPKLPDVPGIDMTGVFTLASLNDAMRMRGPLEAARSVALIGAGYVGLEMAEALVSLGKTVTVLEREHQVLPSIDSDMARIVEYELRRYGVRLHTGSRVLAVTGENGKAGGVKTAAGLGVTPADLVLVDTGAVPNVDLARDAGIRIGTTGGIAVDGHMETNFPGVYAAGNCAESYCTIRRRPVANFLGTVAAKQGRVAGDNLAGRRASFRGSLGTTVLKVFDLAVARTGLTSREAAEERLPFVEARIEALDRAPYFGGGKLWVKLLVDRNSRRLIGAQAVGYGDAARRIDTAATAISSGMRIDDVAQLDLAYSPPYGSLWDPILIAAHAILKLL